MRKIFGVFAFLFVSSLTAQPLTVGTQFSDQGSIAILTSGAPETYVNIANYATAAGTVNKASVDWAATGTCAGAFKIVFLRNNNGPPTAFTVVATRGPFSAITGRNDVTLTPPVTLALGDLIGVVQLQPFATCGSIQLHYYPNTKLGYNLITTSDLSTTGTLGTPSNWASGYSIGAIAYNSDPVLVEILPAAGAVQGAGAFFRTALQLLNATSTVMTGSLVFHKQGAPGSAGDPSLPFTLPPQQAVSYPDVITTMGISGLGSLDIITNGGALPIASARVFSDGGTTGTSGFSEEGVSPNDALDSSDRGILLIPSDLTNFRMNIGVRTLDTGATLNISMVSAGGVLRSTRNGVTYLPYYFIQVPVSDFTGASTIEPGGWIVITLSSTSRAIVYSSVIDNRTSDSTYRLWDVK